MSLNPNSTIHLPFKYSMCLASPIEMEFEPTREGINLNLLDKWRFNGFYV
jgi:hypothetical protein